MAHIHAELMAQYAEDAKQHDKPWELWQFNDGDTWAGCSTHPRWVPDFTYRRKPRTVQVGDIEVPAAVDMGIPMTESAVPKMRPEAWLATFRPKGMLSSHSVAGTNLEELKRSVPSDSKFKPLYAKPILTIVGMSTTAQPQQGGTQQ